MENIGATVFSKIDTAYLAGRLSSNRKHLNLACNKRESGEFFMTIIVTGGAGFIGSNFIFHMIDKYPDYRIVCLDCLTYAGNLSTLEPVMDNPNFRFVKESITDRDAVYKLFEEEHPDMVVNFAARAHVDRSIENPEVFLDTKSSEQLYLWMHAANTVSSVIIRYLQMRFTEICHLTARTFSSQRKLQSIQASPYSSSKGRC